MKVCVGVVAVCFPDLQACVLSSVELQVLTSSCFKLRTVHNIPVTSNKDGKKLLHSFLFYSRPLMCPFAPSSVLCSFNSQKQKHKKVPFTLSAKKKKKPHNERGLFGGGFAGENVGYNMFLIQPIAARAAVARAQLAAPACLYLLQISTMHRFQSLVVTLKPSGWPTLISWNGICMHT